MSTYLTETQAKTALENCSQQEKALLKALVESDTPSQAVRLLELKHEFPTAQLVENRPTKGKYELIRIGHAVRRDPEMAEEMKQEGIAHVDEAAADDWKERALKAVERVCRTKPVFTPDDVWEYVEKPQNPRALGPVMVKAKSLRWCIPTGNYVPSSIPTQHKNPITEWKSLLIPEEDTLL